MFRTQPIPPAYLPPDDALAPTIYALPELSRYPRSLNVAAVLLDGALVEGWGQRTAYFYGDEIITFTEVAQEVNRLANGLRALGIGLGDRVILRMHDTPELVYATLALLRIGAIAVPTYAMLSPAELYYRARDAEAVAMFVHADLLRGIEEVQATCPTLRHLIIAGSEQAFDGVSYRDLVQGQPDACAPAQTGRDDIAFLMYTSGTTGEPKGVIQTHAEHLASADCHGRYALGLTADDVLGGPPAIPFRFGTEFFVIYTLRFGCASVLLPIKTPHVILEAVQRHRVTVLGGVPTFYNMALRELESVAYDLTSVRICVCAGEPMPLAVFERWLAATGVPLTQMLGTTELGWFLGARGPAGLKPLSLGMPIPGFAVVVRDAESFEEVATDTEGLLTVIGPTSAKYWRKPEQQRHAVRQGWTVVPDIVRKDEDGYIYHVARADEMIVSAGYNIPPAQVEQVLRLHAAVAEVACVAAPDPQGVRSAIVKAFVVLQDGYQPDDALRQDLQRTVRENAAPYMYPREIEFLDQLPKTFNGKIRRTALKERAWATTAPATTA